MVGFEVTFFGVEGGMGEFFFERIRGSQPYTNTTIKTTSKKSIFVKNSSDSLFWDLVLIFFIFGGEVCLKFFLFFNGFGVIVVGEFLGEFFDSTINCKGVIFWKGWGGLEEEREGEKRERKEKEKKRKEKRK